MFFNFLQHLPARVRVPCVVCFLTTFHPNGWFTSLCSLTLTTVFTVYYYTAYTGQRRTQTFRTREEAERQAAFYRSCGVKSELV